MFPTIGGRLAAAAGTVLLVALVAGCSAVQGDTLKGSGPVKTETRAATGFHAVEVRDGIHVELVAGKPESVEVAAQENLLPLIRVVVDGGTLTIDATGSFSTSLELAVRVSVPSLTEVAAIGGASASGRGIQAGTLAVRTEGGGSAVLEGSADRIVLTSIGGGTANLRNLVAHHAQVNLEGGVVARVNASGSVRGSATGGVVLTVAGSPATLAVATMGGAVVRAE